MDQTDNISSGGRFQLRRGFTLRSFIIGSILAAFLNVACPYCVLVMRTSGLTSDYITQGAIMLFFILVAMLNPLLKLIDRRIALSSAELVLIYIMMIVASAIPTWGLVTNMFHILTRPFYYASPENDWEHLFFRYIRKWMVCTDHDAIRYFYEGLPKGKSIPWRPWVVPIFWWMVLMLSIYFVMICLMVMFRKQWVVYERLSFPVVQPALEMVRGNDTNVVNPLFKSRLMWIFFAISFVIVGLNGLNHYFPIFPHITFRHWYGFMRRKVWVLVFWNFVIIGVTYFINLDIALSLWLFHLLNKIEGGIFRITGFSLRGHNEALCGSSAATSSQGMGAMIMLTIVTVWAARQHLRMVFRKAFRGDESIDDSDEIMSYRMAVFGTIFGSLIAIGWYHASGMSWSAASVFLMSAFLICFALTRIVAQGGVGFTSAQMIPQPFVVYAFGTDFFGPSGLTSLHFTYAWAAEMRTLVMTSAIDGMKLADATRSVGRPLAIAMVLAILSGLAGSITTTLMVNYKFGGANLGMFGVPHICVDFLVDKLRNPVHWDIMAGRWLFTGIGMAVMYILVLLRQWVPWWPVHYLGFALSDSWVMGWAWFSVFVGWLAKLILLKVGGAAMYERAKPAFLGMILGQLMAGAFWKIVDLITGETGNYIWTGVI